MNWISKLEKRFGHLAINNLMLYIIILNSFVYIMDMMDRSGRFISRLTLIPSLVIRGEVWRLFTYIFIPPRTSIIFIIFVLYFYYMIGTGLERYWGSFRFNLYYLLGVIATTIVSFLTGGIGTSIYLNLTLFLAFARIYPDFQILIFFILPVKMKYLAWFTWGMFIYSLIVVPFGQKITVIIALSNYFLFFGRDLIRDLKRKRKVQSNRKRFDLIKSNDADSIHKCTVCGITEKDDPEMEFRYCSKCEGDYEYCNQHLKNHEHK